MVTSCVVFFGVALWLKVRVEITNEIRGRKSRSFMMYSSPPKLLLSEVTTMLDDSGYRENCQSSQVHLLRKAFECMKAGLYPPRLTKRPGTDEGRRGLDSTTF